MARVYNGKCHSLNQLEMYKCNSELSSRALPQEYLLILMINPVVNSIVFKSLRFEHVFLSWIIVIATLVVCVIYANATQSLPAICTYIPTSLLLLFENHRQDLILFFVVKSQKRLLVENKRMSDEMATEMRHMIANVAHDLKTVSFILLILPSFCSVYLLSPSATVRVYERRGDCQEWFGIHQRATRGVLLREKRE